MKRKIQLFGIFTMLFIILMVGLKTTFDGYFGFYYEDDNYQKPFLYKFSESVVYSEPVSRTIAYTGFDTGYGFFAPNVASDFVLLFELYDSTGNSINKTIMPRFNQKESRVRFTSIYNMFLDKLKNKKGKEQNQYFQYLDLIIGQIALSVKKDYPNAEVISAKLYLYDYPDLKRYRQGKQNENAVLITELKR